MGRQEENNFVNITYNLYKTLEVRPPCTEDDLAKAYKRLALKYHPDKVRSGENNSERFEKISAAYAFLKDPIKREFYDRFGDSGVENILKGDESGGVSRLGDTSTFIGKFTLKILSKPIRLIPLFFFIASIGICFLLFLNMLDKKMYAHELKDYSWTFVFSFLWIDEGLLALFFAILSYSIFSNFKAFSRMEEQVTFGSLPERRRAFLSKIETIAILFTTSFVSICTMIVMHQQYIMSIHMDNELGVLQDVTWWTLFGPILIALIVYLVMIFTYTIIMSLKYDSWKIRSLKIFSALSKSILLASFVYYMPLWLDSSDRSLDSLLKIFSFLYLAIIIHGVAFNVKARWSFKKKLKTLLESVSHSQQDEMKKRARSNAFVAQISINIVYSVLLSMAVLLHLHLARYWPYTWTMTLFPLILCTGTSIFVFGCCFPCIVTCLDCVLPRDSFDKFNLDGTPSTSTCSNNVQNRTIYPFGYGFAPVQPLIQFK